MKGFTKIAGKKGVTFYEGKVGPHEIILVKIKDKEGHWGFVNPHTFEQEFVEAKTLSEATTKISRIVLARNYKLRAECVGDILEFLEMKMPSILRFKIEKPTTLPDCVFEFSTEASLAEIKSCLREIPDGHVMVETVQLVCNYTGIRQQEKDLEFD